MALSVTALGAPATTEAIVGGHVVAKSSYPWHVVIDDNCAGVLVSPSRVLTSANCINESFLKPGERLRIHSQRPRIAGIANHPLWVREEFALADECKLSPDCIYNGDFLGIYCNTGMICPHDVALIGLDRPVRLPQLPRLAASSSGSRVTAIGAGVTDPDSEDDDGRLRAVTLKRISDRACAQRYARAGRAWLRTFDASTMLCAADASKPRRAGLCIADWGGPLLSRAGGHWRVVGIASWNRDCGRGGWPSVFSDVWQARSFIRSKHPSWLPAMKRNAARLTGTPRVGEALTCLAPPTSAPATSWIFTFADSTVGDGLRQRGPSAIYVAGERDRGVQLECRVEARNAGGVGISTSSDVVIG